MNFDRSFEKLLGHEGGYTEGKGDPGGETKYGISKRAYPSLDIRALTVDQAKAIYLRDYWGAAGCGEVPEWIAFDLFDTAVNSGVSRAVRTLQRAAGVLEDGQLGPRTLGAVARMDPGRLTARFNGARLNLLTSLPGWPQFGRGWAARVASNLLEA